MCTSNWLTTCVRENNGCQKSVTRNRKGIPEVPRRHLKSFSNGTRQHVSSSWRPVIPAMDCSTWRKHDSSPPSPIREMIMESLKSTDKSFTIRTHGYSHETHPVLDCTRIRVSQTHFVLLARMLKGSKVHNVHNSAIGTSRSVCACAQPALNRCTAKLIKTGLLMTYPTIHTCISFC